jgi:hypothetical protein
MGRKAANNVSAAIALMCSLYADWQRIPIVDENRRLHSEPLRRGQ